MCEKKFDEIMLVSDLDGTLLNSKCELSKENIDAIKYFVENGGKFTIATGRAEFGVAPYTSKLSINIPGILYNGALAYDFQSDRPLWDDCLEDDVEDVVDNLLDIFPDMGVEVFHRGQVYCVRECEETEKHSKKEEFIPHYVPLNMVPKPWYKIILAWKPEKLVEVERQLEGVTGSFRSVYSEPQFLELLGKRVSKGNALRMLVEKLGLKMKNVVSIGDNLNDRELIEMAGVGFAVDNAHGELKKAADYSCCHHDSHAAAEVINWIEQNLEIFGR